MEDRGEPHALSEAEPRRRVRVDLASPGASRFGVGLVTRAFTAELARLGPHTDVGLVTPGDSGPWRGRGTWQAGTQALVVPGGLTVLAPLRPTFALLGAEAEQLAGGFFDELERRDLTRRLETLRDADRLFVTRAALRGPVAEALRLPGERVRAVRLEATSRLQPASADVVAAVRARHGLARPFLLHPGGARLQHNLTLLLAGLRLLLARHGGLALDLVLAVRPDEWAPGAVAPPGDVAEIAANAERFGLGAHVRVLGCLDDGELGALYGACAAVVLPWLYPTLGLTVCEALRFGRPLLLSTGLPPPAEAEDAALRFDPRRPEAIADALATALDRPRLGALAAASQAARERLDGSGTGLAAACLERLDELASRARGARVVRLARPALSVVTPSLDQAPFIERSVSSVLGQGIAGLEYVVMDGGSRDGTLDVLRRHADDLRFESRRDGGQAAAVNAGLRATSGAVVGWLNSDDVYYAGALEQVLRFFEAHPEIDLVYGEADHIDARDVVLGPYPTEDWNYERLKETCFLCQPAVFLRRRVLERFGLLDARLRYCMDYEYWLRVGPHVRLARLPRRLAGSRLHAGAKTLRARVAVHAEINDMLRRRLRYVPERWLHNYAWAVVDAAGHDRARLEDYAWLLTRATLWAFVRWRWRVPRHVLVTAAGWLREARARRRGLGARA